MHEHVEVKPKKCKHDLKYCEKCDEVYCEKCKKEWKKPKPFNYLKEIDRWNKKKEDVEPIPRWTKEDFMLCSHKV